MVYKEVYKIEDVRRVLIWALLFMLIVGGLIIAGMIMGKDIPGGIIGNIIAGLIGSAVGSKLLGTWGPVWVAYQSFQH